MPLFLCNFIIATLLLEFFLSQARESDKMQQKYYYQYQNVIQRMASMNYFNFNRKNLTYRLSARQYWKCMT